MTTKLSKAFLKEMGADKLQEVKSLKIEFVNFSGNSAQVKIWVENKFGLFEIYPTILRQDRWFSVGQSLNLQTGKDFKIKSRINIS